MMLLIHIFIFIFFSSLQSNKVKQSISLIKDQFVENMNKFCEHLNNVKIQKISNIFIKSKLQCSGNKKHADSTNIDICLSCGQNRCQNYDQTLCSYQHSYGTKHPLVYRTQQKYIYCFICKQNLTLFLLQSPQSDKDLKKIDKMLDIHNRILQNAEKISLEKQIAPIQQPKGKQKKKKMKQKNIKVKKQEEDDQTQNYGQKEEKLIIQQLNSKKLMIFGLKNLGNTCFFNSTIQCLYATEILHHLYPSIKIDTQRQFGKIGQLIILFNKFLKNTDQFYTPKSLFNWVCKSKGVYKHMDQQDAQEFLGVIINGLIDSQQFWKKQLDNENNKIKTKSLTQKIFGFTLASRLQCLQCSKVSWSLDFSLEIAVQLSKAKERKANLPQGQIPQEQIGQQGLFYPQQKLSSSSIIDNFFSPQFFTKQNYFECQNCQSQKAFRKFYIKDPPLILIITLKRFNNNLSKNNSHVNIYKNLQMEGHCLNKGQYLYELYAMVVHSGTAKGGHYIAYTCRQKDWYYFSDGSFKAQSWQKVKSSQPYILFYKKITT